MKQKTKKILIWISSVIVIGIIGYIGFVGYVVYTFSSNCGMDDGPFYAVGLTNAKFSASAQTFKLSGGKLILDNRSDTLSPILAFEQNGNLSWILDTDVSKTAGYEDARIWKISNLKIEDGPEIKIRFIGHWTFGAEVGTMEIDKKTGKNSFCLSW